MGKILVLVVLGFIAYALWRSGVTKALRAARRHGNSAPGTDNAGNTSNTNEAKNSIESMVRCAHCGLHLPAGEAVLAAGKMYCSREHVEES